MRRVLAELALGVRLAFAGGRRGWLRTAMATLGVGIGAAGLLLAASVPTMLDGRQARTDARYDSPGGVTVPAGRTTILAGPDGQSGDNAIRARLLWPEAPGAPLPPGVPAFPGDHQMYVSPALRAALDGPDGDTLRRQMPYEIVGTIAPAGLSGPHEYAYYAGYQRATALVEQQVAWRVDRFGYPSLDVEAGAGGTYVIVAVLVATLLLPVAIFIGAALRFGGDSRDRRLAAIRLIGADSRAVLRMAIGESLVPAGLGLLLGLLFYLLIRGQVERFWLFDVSVYSADVRPVPSLAVLAVAVILGLSAGVTLLGFRGVTVEPLGVLRQAPTWRGRLWWRLIAPAASLLLLYPVLLGRENVGEARTGIGAVLLIVALIPLLPYVVPVVARLLPDGTASWQLASQQLRRNPSSSTRAVSGIVVAVAGAIALQSLFGAAEVERSIPYDKADPAFLLQARDRTSTDAMKQRSARFEQVSGVRAGTVALYTIYQKDIIGLANLYIGDCRSLSQLATLTGGCEPGDTFTAGSAEKVITIDKGEINPAPGVRLAVPAKARKATLIGSNAQGVASAVLMTTIPAQLARVEPGFVETRMFTDEKPAVVAGKLRGVAAEIDPLAMFTAMAPEGDRFGPLRVALNVGSTLILLMMAVGLLLDVAARLHERRRILGVLAAVGARDGTVIWSVLLQVIVPVAAGLSLAVGAGTGIGALLMRLSQVPVIFTAGTVLLPVAAGAGLVLITTVAVLLPAVRRVTRTEELRYE
ncbi:ABC transporter permease [Actinoplanes sp. HUAS TT8]|uniref:ABC transporter permease n=1 Tax=Actinoplanes sp. HUAS TT8 TaxID=3447453 RepID=UPI003F51D20D